MSSSGASSSLSTPVFVFPDRLDFYVGDQSTHKRVLTLYNPFDVDIVFKVFCNKPSRYSVVEPEGVVGAQRCVDIVVRHLAAFASMTTSMTSTTSCDKVRIQILDASRSETLGKKDIVATLKPGCPEEEESHSHSLPSISSTEKRSLKKQRREEEEVQEMQRQEMKRLETPNAIAIVTLVVCVGCLLLPTEGSVTSDSLFVDQPWLHLSFNLKLAVAYVLGMVTATLLRRA